VSRRRWAPVVRSPGVVAGARPPQSAGLREVQSKLVLTRAAVPAEPLGVLDASAVPAGPLRVPDASAVPAEPLRVLDASAVRACVRARCVFLLARGGQVFWRGACDVKLPSKYSLS